MTHPPAKAPSTPETSERTSSRSSLQTRLRIYAVVGLIVVGAWLYYTVIAVLSLYDATLQIARNTDLRERVTDATSGLSEATDSLDRYTRNGEGYDLAQFHVGRTALLTSLGAIRRHPLTEGTRGTFRRAEAAADVFTAAADRALALRKGRQPGEAYAVRDNEVGPAASRLRESLAELERIFGRSQLFAEQQLKANRDAATTALVVLAALILLGIYWLLADVNSRIVSPCAAAADALGDLASGRPTPRLFDLSRDEIGSLGRNFNEAARVYAESARALEARDIEASVNAVLAAAATINDLAGFGSKLLEKVLEVTGASSAVLYLAEGGGQFVPAAALGGSARPEGSGSREEARRAAREGKAILVSVDAQTPTVDLFDGRILPRESIHLPLMYFGEPVGVLALGAVKPFSERARNTLTAIAPSLAVALANASANERLAEQSRRLAEQNELLEEQRSRIERTAQELQRASALKDRFLAAVSHELRTPMTVILGFTGTLLRGTQGDLTAQQRESLERVQRNARLLLGLINDVLDISKIEAGKSEIRLEVISIPALLDQVVADFDGAARRKGLELTTAAAPNLGTVISDPAKLTQILANLVGNALKFTDRGTIDVRAEPRGQDQWALVVTDSGIGIAPDEQEAIFEEFRQGESTSREARGGTGLGLAIVRKLAILLGGTVGIQSTPGKGSTFTVTLPRELPGSEAEEADLPRELPAASDGRRALVVDDDESTRHLLRVELEAHGFSVLEAADGRAGIELARLHKPDAIILDILMPRLDGWSALRALKESAETRQIPVLMHSVVDSRALGISLGAFDYLVKPVAPGRLFEVLSRAGVSGFPGYVLVVDDDPEIRQLMEHELTGSGFRTLAVGGGEEALAQIRRERPSAILLDLLMPDPNGFEVLYRLRESPDLRDVPVIVMTAKELTAADYEKLNGSAQKILQKGTDMTRLMREVLRAVDPRGLPSDTASAEQSESGDG
jgi:signal transduction histidine kinase/DNA-binding response OmpR family regulator